MTYRLSDEDRETAIKAVHALEAQHEDPSVEQYADAALAAIGQIVTREVAAAKAEAHEDGYQQGLREGRDEAETRDLSFDVLTDRAVAAERERNEERIKRFNAEGALECQKRMAEVTYADRDEWKSVAHDGAFQQARAEAAEAKVAAVEALAELKPLSERIWRVETQDFGGYSARDASAVARVVGDAIRAALGEARP